MQLSNEEAHSILPTPSPLAVILLPSQSLPHIHYHPALTLTPPPQPPPRRAPPRGGCPPRQRALHGAQVGAGPCRQHLVRCVNLVWFRLERIGFFTLCGDHNLS